MSRRTVRWTRGLLASAALLPLAAFCLGTSVPVWAQDEKPMLLQADQLVYDSDGQTVSAVGHVEIVDDTRILNADNVTYDQKNDKVTASGHVSITDARGNVAFADHVVLTDRMRNGALSGFGALIGKNGRLAAASAQRVQDRLVIAQRAVYTPCKICAQKGQRHPLWQVKSEKVVLDQVKHRVHFTDATVDVFGVPVLYTPYLVEPDPTVKYASGLLAPDVGNSTKIGNFIRLPVYLALSDTNDMTVVPEITTQGGELIEAEYRQRWNNSGLWLQASGAYNSHGGLGGAPGTQDYDHIFGAGRFALTDTWRTGFDTELTNNNAYMRLYDISYLDRLVNDIFLEDSYGRSRFAITSYYFQGLRSTDIARRIPFVAPLIEYSYIPLRNFLGGQFRLDLNGIALARGSGRDEQRLTSEMNWRKPVVVAGGQLWTFVLDGRSDGYNIQSPTTTTARGTSQQIGRGTGYAELDWRWPFVANGSPGHSYLLEPIAQVIGQPYASHPAILRDEDSSDFEFDENNLFSVNQMPGYDLLESGPRANLGLQALTYFPTGQASAVIGQTIRVKSDPIFSTDSGQKGTASDVVGEVSVKFPHLDVTDRIDLDRDRGTLRRHEVYVTGSYGRSSLQVTYLQLPSQSLTLGLPSREQVNAQADINFYENWEAFAAIERDLQAGQMLDTEYGIGYEDECLAISVAYRRKYTFDTILGVPPSTSVVLHFSLKTGDQPVQPFSLFPKNVFNSSSHS
jgi:LPS-assembly protein